jgi:hypothetical protein
MLGKILFKQFLYKMLGSSVLIYKFKFENAVEFVASSHQPYNTNHTMLRPFISVSLMVKTMVILNHIHQNRLFPLLFFWNYAILLFFEIMPYCYISCNVLQGRVQCLLVMKLIRGHYYIGTELPHRVSQYYVIYGETIYFLCQ